MSGMKVPVLRDAITARVSARRMESVASLSFREALAVASAGAASALCCTLSAPARVPARS